MINPNQKKLLAVSGGVDSMVLLDQFKNQNIVVAFVNYNLRRDVEKDQSIVTNFCTQHKIPLEILSIQESSSKNFQNWAREKRYDFFSKIYNQYSCNQLIVAHHKDDFLETAIMQKKKNENKLFYGIKQETKILNMNVYRPFLFKYWKDEIYQYAKDNEIPFNDDYTNFENKYQRNKIRNLELAKFEKEEKEKLLNSFLEINKSNESLQEAINISFDFWKETEFSTKVFSQLENKELIVEKYLNQKQPNINLSKNIIKNFIAFIKSNNGNKKFKFNNNFFIQIQSGKLI